MTPTAQLEPRTDLAQTRRRIGRIADQTEIERVTEKLAHPLGAGILETMAEDVVAAIDTDYVKLCDGDRISAARVREMRIAAIAMDAVKQWQDSCLEEIENARD